MKRRTWRISHQKKMKQQRKDKGKYILGRARPGLVSFNLAVLILLPPMSQRKKPSHPRVPQKGQHCRSRSLIPEHRPHRRGHRASLFAQPPNPLPHGSCLAGPRQAPGHEEKSGLSLAGIAIPAPIQVDLAHSFEVRPKRSMAGEELVVPPGQLFLCAPLVLVRRPPPGVICTVARRRRG